MGTDLVPGGRNGHPSKKQLATVLMRTAADTLRVKTALKASHTRRVAARQLHLHLVAETEKNVHRLLADVIQRQAQEIVDHLKQQEKSYVPSTKSPNDSVPLALLAGRRQRGIDPGQSVLGSVRVLEKSGDSPIGRILQKAIWGTAHPAERGQDGVPGESAGPLTGASASNSGDFECSVYRRTAGGSLSVRSILGMDQAGGLGRGLRDRGHLEGGAEGDPGTLHLAAAATGTDDPDGRGGLSGKGLGRYDGRSLTYKTEGPHDYSCVMVNLPEPLRSKVLDLGKTIPDSELAEDGRETTPHVTVLYGLHTENADDVRSILQAFGPVTVKLGLLSVFENEDADVVWAEVESPQLNKMNAALKELPYTSTHPGYIAHVCIAYVKPGEGSKYVDDDDLVGLEATIDTAVFSPATGPKVTVPLLGDNLVRTKGDKPNHRFYGNQHTGGGFSPELTQDQLTETAADLENNWPPESDRLQIGRWAIKDAQAGGGSFCRCSTIQDEKGTASVASVKRKLDEVSSTGMKAPAGQYMEIVRLATREPGFGRRMMDHLVQQAADQGAGVYLEPVDEAVAFYEHLGMHEDNRTGYFFWSPDECRTRVGKKEVHYEPTAGVFINTSYEVA